MDRAVGTRSALLVDALRGGRAAWLPERDTAAELAKKLPAAKRAVIHSDRFAAAVAERAVSGGTGNIVFGGIGYPAGTAPHKAAAAASETARFFYAHADQVMTDLRKRSLEGDRQATAFRASVLNPGSLVAAGALAGLLRGRVQVQWGFAAWVLDGGEAAGLASRWAALLRPGDELVMTAAEHAGQLGEAAGVRWHGHTLDEVAGWAEAAKAADGTPLLRVAERVHDVRGWPRRWPGLVPHPGERVVAVIADRR